MSATPAEAQVTLLKDEVRQLQLKVQASRMVVALALELSRAEAALDAVDTDARRTGALNGPQFIEATNRRQRAIWAITGLDQAALALLADELPATRTVH